MTLTFSLSFNSLALGRVCECVCVYVRVCCSWRAILFSRSVCVPGSCSSNLLLRVASLLWASVF